MGFERSAARPRLGQPAKASRSRAPRGESRTAAHGCLGLTPVPPGPARPSFAAHRSTPGSGSFPRRSAEPAVAGTEARQGRTAAAHACGPQSGARLGLAAARTGGPRRTGTANGRAGSRTGTDGRGAGVGERGACCKHRGRQWAPVTSAPGAGSGRGGAAAPRPRRRRQWKAAAAAAASRRPRPRRAAAERGAGRSSTGPVSRYGGAAGPRRGLRTAAGPSARSLRQALGVALHPRPVPGGPSLARCRCPGAPERVPGASGVRGCERESVAAMGP